MTPAVQKAASGKAMSTKRKAPAPLDDEQFRYLQNLAGSVSGIVLESSKRQMLYARLSRRLKELGLNDYDTYIERLSSGDPAELKDFTNRITTNLTHFYREPGHFRYLTEQILPEFTQTRGEHRPLRIWSAGCSTGQEPYSIAMCVGSFARPLHAPPRILCTDLNSEVLATVVSGRFTRDSLRGLTEAQIRRWFRKLEPNCFEAVEALRSMLVVKQHNLMGVWPIRPPVDAIFCRNVLIYFSAEAQNTLIQRFTDLLASGGHLFLGHSESLAYPHSRLQRVATTIYRKVSQ